MRKGNNGEEKNGGKNSEKTDENSGHYVIASSRLPQRHRLNDDRWNAARSCQKYQVLTHTQYFDIMTTSVQPAAAVKRNNGKRQSWLQHLEKTDSFE